MVVLGRGPGLRYKDSPNDGNFVPGVASVMGAWAARADDAVVVVVVVNSD